MIYAESNSFFKVWDVDKKERECVLTLGTSRKDKRTDEYLNSNWSYVHFVGDAFEKACRLERGDRITSVKFGLSWEPYEKDGKKIYAKSPRMVVFDFEVADSAKKQNRNDDFDNEAESDDDLPF